MAFLRLLLSPSLLKVRSNTIKKDTQSIYTSTSTSITCVHIYLDRARTGLNVIVTIPFVVLVSVMFGRW